jgi:hypothetical protein
VFVTENPSVLAAASTQALAGDTATTPRVVCTAGTPSQVECAAVGALSEAGWNVAVRADFDPAGLAHVRALLAAAPAARPWRMSAADYVAVAIEGTLDLHVEEADAPGTRNWQQPCARTPHTPTKRTSCRYCSRTLQPARHILQSRHEPETRPDHPRAACPT